MLEKLVDWEDGPGAWKEPWALAAASGPQPTEARKQAFSPLAPALRSSESALALVRTGMDGMAGTRSLQRKTWANLNLNF